MIAVQPTALAVKCDNARSSVELAKEGRAQIEQDGLGWKVAQNAPSQHGPTG
jgi:hypothetical protein